MSASHIGTIHQSRDEKSPVVLNPTHGHTGWQRIVDGKWIEMRYMNLGGYTGWMTLTEFLLQIEQIREHNRNRFQKLPYEERRRIMHPVPKQRHLMHI